MCDYSAPLTGVLYGRLKSTGGLQMTMLRLILGSRACQTLDLLETHFSTPGFLGLKSCSQVIFFTDIISTADHTATMSRFHTVQRACPQKQSSVQVSNEVATSAQLVRMGPVPNLFPLRQ